jgi:hypothetical protein
MQINISLPPVRNWANQIVANIPETLCAPDTHVVYLVEMFVGDLQRFVFKIGSCEKGLTDRVKTLSNEYHHYGHIKIIGAFEESKKMLTETSLQRICNEYNIPASVGFIKKKRKLFEMDQEVIDIFRTELEEAKGETYFDGRYNLSRRLSKLRNLEIIDENETDSEDENSADDSDNEYEAEGLDRNIRYDSDASESEEEETDRSDSEDETDSESEDEFVGDYRSKRKVENEDRGAKRQRCRY